MNTAVFSTNKTDQQNIFENEVQDKKKDVETREI